MSEWWEGLSVLQKVFAYMALPATFVLIIQTILVLFGLGDHDMDAGHGFDAHGFHVGHASHLGHTGHDGSDGHDGLALFSIRGIVAFFAVGGWAGIVAAGMSFPPVLAVAAFLLCGAVALYAVALIFRMATRLQDSGNLSLENAVGKTGTVYITIPGARKGTGKVTLTFQDRFSECDAVSDAAENLKTGTLVEVVDLADENTLVVSPIPENTQNNSSEVGKWTQ